MYLILCGEYREKTIQQMKYRGVFFAVFQGASLRFHLQAFFIENADGYSDLIVCQLHTIDDFVILHVDYLSFLFTYIIYEKEESFKGANHSCDGIPENRSGIFHQKWAFTRMTVNGYGQHLSVIFL